MSFNTIIIAIILLVGLAQLKLTAGVFAIFLIGVISLAVVYVRRFQPEFIVHKSGVIFITGASTGIGFAAAAKLAKLGYDVLATVRTARDFKALEVGELIVSNYFVWLLCVAHVTARMLGSLQF